MNQWRQATCLSTVHTANNIAFISKSMVVCLIAAAGLAWPGCVSASAKIGMAFPHAMTPSFRWSEPVNMHVSGVPVVVRGFVASTTLDDVARVMARHQRHFQRVTTLPGSILLSGVYDGRHWVAQLEAGPRHVNGLVSTLPLNVEPAPNNGQGSVLTPWLTQNAGLVFSQSSTVRGRPVAQSLHRPKLPLDDFVSAFTHRMARAGWKPDGKHSWVTGASQKRLGRIDLFPVPATKGQGGAVFISQTH